MPQPPAPLPTGTVDDWEVTVSAKKKQNAGKKVAVKALSSRDGDAAASGKVKLKRGKGSSALAAVKKSALKLKPASAGLSADQRVTLKLKLKKKGLNAIKKALKAGRKATAKITVEVTDGLGGSVTEKRTVKLK